MMKPYFKLFELDYIEPATMFISKQPPYVASVKGYSVVKEVDDGSREGLMEVAKSIFGCDFVHLRKHDKTYDEFYTLYVEPFWRNADAASCQTEDVKFIRKSDGRTFPGLVIVKAPQYQGISSSTFHSYADLLNSRAHNPIEDPHFFAACINGWWCGVLVEKNGDEWRSIGYTHELREDFVWIA